MMQIIIKCLILSLLMALTCKIYFETVAEKRRWRKRWIEHTVLPAFMMGFMVIAFTEIPPYILQPVRTIAVIFIVAQIYFRVKLLQNFMLSTFFCVLLWIITALVDLSVYIMPQGNRELLMVIEEFTSQCILLCLVLLLHMLYKGKKGIYTLAGTSWIRFGYFPIFSMVVIMALTMFDLSNSLFNGGILFIIITGFGVINILAFYFVSNILSKEAEVNRLRLMHERSQNQMNLYRNMQKNYEQQRRYMHDYKNQLNCIQGLITDGRIEKAQEYVEGLTGKVQQNMDYVNTNHPIVNVVLNQKYKYAQDKDITMTMLVNDLSGLNMNEEDIVTLLVNLIDNAVEACEELDCNRVIQFKMILEAEQLVLSIRNPVRNPVKISGKTITTTKKKMSEHGIGLLNVNSVIEKTGGISVLKCEEGWFCFSAIIPVE